jgi:hypothetical protein
MEAYMANSTVPATNAQAIDTSSDTTIDPSYCRGIFIGTAGDLVVDMAGEKGKEITFKVAAGTLVPIVVTKIYSSSNGTSADDLVVVS